MQQAIIWTNADPVHWRINASLGGDELMKDCQGTSPLRMTNSSGKWQP